MTTEPPARPRPRSPDVPASAGPSTGPRRPTAGDAGWLLPLLLLFMVKGLAIAALFGPFSGHDEVDHFYYVARLAAGDGLGVVGEVDLPPAAAPYRAYVADYPTNAEVIQPPLYHALLVPFYLLVPGDEGRKLFVLRLASLPLGAGVVWLAARTARLLFPTDRLVRVGTPLFVAFHPQFAFEAAIVNHDVLLILLSSLVLYRTLLGLQRGFSRRDQWLLGLLAAAGLWTKMSFALVLPVVALGLVLAWRDRATPRRDLLTAAGRSLLLPSLLIAPWLLRNWLLYGDPTGTARLRLIPGFGSQAQTIGEMVSSAGFWRQMLEDFWGNYGWRQIPFDPALYRLVWLLWGIALAGILVSVLRAVGRPLPADPAVPAPRPGAVGASRPGPVTRGGRVTHGRGANPDRLSSFQLRSLALLALAVGLFIFAVLYVGTVQFTQARFAFPAMVPLGLFTLLGLSGWLPARLRPVALPVLGFVLMLLNVVVAIRFVLPFYFGPGGGAAFPR